MKIRLPLLLLTALSFPSGLHAAGIPCLDIAVLGQNMKQLLQDEISQLQNIAQSKAQMFLEEQLNLELTDVVANATAEQTARITDSLAGVQNAVAEAVNIPPPSACKMYNESKNAVTATSGRSLSLQKQVSRYMNNLVNVGENALPTEIKQKEQFSGIYGRFVESIRTGANHPQLNTNNFFRTGEYQDKDISNDEAISRQDMLDILSNVKTTQPFDYRKSPDSFTEDDFPLVMEHMTNVARASLVRGALVELYSLYAQTDGGPSVAEVISEHNKNRFLNPDWVKKITNTDPGMESFIQPEAIMREQAHTNAYIAYISELRYRLQQWQTAIAATQLALDVERNEK